MNISNNVFAALFCEFRGIVCESHLTEFNVDGYRRSVAAEAMGHGLSLHHRAEAVRLGHEDWWETRFAVTWMVNDRRRVYSVVGLATIDTLDLSAGGSPSNRSVLLEVLYEAQRAYHGDLDYWLEDGLEDDILSEIIHLAQQHESWIT